MKEVDEQDNHSDVIFLANNAVMDHRSNYVAGVPTGHSNTDNPENRERMDYYKRQIEERTREVAELKIKMQQDRK